LPLSKDFHAPRDVLLDSSDKGYLGRGSEERIETFFFFSERLAVVWGKSGGEYARARGDVLFSCSLFASSSMPALKPPLASARARAREVRNLFRCAFAVEKRERERVQRRDSSKIRCVFFLRGKKQKKRFFSSLFYPRL
jgi:hypothetical protein